MKTAGPCPRCTNPSVVVIDIIWPNAAGFDRQNVFQCCSCEWRAPVPPSPTHWQLAVAMHLETLRIFRSCSGALTPARKIRRLDGVRACQRTLALLRMQRAQTRAVSL